MQRFEYCCISHIAGLPHDHAIVSLLTADRAGGHAIRSVELPSERADAEGLDARLAALSRGGWVLVKESTASVQEVTSRLYMFRRRQA